MKKVISFILITLLLLSFTACEKSQKETVLDSVGEYTRICYYSEGFRDLIDYGKYQFNSPKLENNIYLKKADEDAIVSLNTHLDEYELWVNDILDKVPYDFDRSIITDTDYIYIYDDPNYSEYGYFNIYFYDSETDILYFFHVST